MLHTSRASRRIFRILANVVVNDSSARGSLLDAARVAHRLRRSVAIQSHFEHLAFNVLQALADFFQLIIELCDLHRSSVMIGNRAEDAGQVSNIAIGRLLVGNLPPEFAPAAGNFAAHDGAGERDEFL